MASSEKAKLLTYKEHVILLYVVSGWKNKDIAYFLETTEHVIKNAMGSIYDKTGMDNRVQLAMWVIKRQFDYIMSLQGIEKHAALIRFRMEMEKEKDVAEWLYSLPGGGGQGKPRREKEMLLLKPAQAVFQRLED